MAASRSTIIFEKIPALDNTSYKLRGASYELKFESASSNLRVQLVNPQVASLNLRATSSYPQAKSSDLQVQESLNS